MPVQFIDNYAQNNLASIIKNSDGSPLYGEIWLYEQFIKFNDNNLIPDDNWYFKHDYSLSKHYNSRDTKSQVEGQIDFILVNKNGILIIEIKGGSISVDEGIFYSTYNIHKRQITDPFKQVKNYVHTLKELINTAPFIYRAVIFPHEAGFIMKGPELSGYKEIFFSRADFQHYGSDENSINKLFFNFINELGKKAKKNNIKELYPQASNSDIDSKILSRYPMLDVKEIKRIKSELFPNQASYVYNPDKITSDIIQNDNYQILKGLRRNKKVMVQGPPGSGKTILATKFLAEHLIKQHKGIFFCANKLVRSKIEHLLLKVHQLDSNLISFKIYSESITIESIDDDVDFIIFDEAQEFFNKGLFDFIEKLNNKLKSPDTLILYDPEQSIINEFCEMGWYTDYFIDSGFTHYLFDEMFRCIQNKDIAKSAAYILNNKFKQLEVLLNKNFNIADSLVIQLSILKEITDLKEYTKSEIKVLVHSDIIQNFKHVVSRYFLNEFEELTDLNINVQSQKIRYTTPIKFRGLEAECIYVITPSNDDKTKVQNYIGATRAMFKLNFVIWK